MSIFIDVGLNRRKKPYYGHSPVEHKNVKYVCGKALCAPDITDAIREHITHFHAGWALTGYAVTTHYDLGRIFCDLSNDAKVDKLRHCVEYISFHCNGSGYTIFKDGMVKGDLWNVQFHRDVMPHLIRGERQLESKSEEDSLSN